VSRLRDVAAALVAKIRTQALASRIPGQTDDERRVAFAAIDPLLEELMREIHELEVVVDPLADVAARRDGSGEYLRAIVEGIEIYVARAEGRPGPKSVEGFARAGDVQIPIAPDPEP